MVDLLIGEDGIYLSLLARRNCHGRLLLDRVERFVRRVLLRVEQIGAIGQGGMKRLMRCVLLGMERAMGYDLVIVEGRVRGLLRSSEGRDSRLLFRMERLVCGRHRCMQRFMARIVLGM